MMCRIRKRSQQRRTRSRRFITCRILMRSQQSSGVDCDNDTRLDRRPSCLHCGRLQRCKHLWTSTGSKVLVPVSQMESLDRGNGVRAYRICSRLPGSALVLEADYKFVISAMDYRSDCNFDMKSVPCSTPLPVTISGARNLARRSLLMSDALILPCLMTPPRAKIASNNHLWYLLSSKSPSLPSLKMC
jgi:hypothetical protein